MKKLFAVALTAVAAASAQAAPPTPNTPGHTVPWVEHVGKSQGTVTQITTIATGVTLDAYSGVITTVSSTLAAVTTTGFVVTNAAVGAGSVVIANVVNYGGTYETNGIPVVTVDTIAEGSFTIKLSNAHASNALSGVLKIGFIVL